MSPQWPLVLWYDHFLGNVVEVAAALFDIEVEVENPTTITNDMVMMMMWQAHY
jgi:hypothetical protein